MRRPARGEQPLYEDHDGSTYRAVYRGVFPAKLSDAQSRANTVLDRFGKRQQVPFRRSHPVFRRSRIGAFRHRNRTWNSFYNA
jgi:hypothetical protein